ncbi:TIGR03086 family metal-binding protein [Paractinoplanes globisporus]|uniref:TIGR03086 family metal-binding protein n=1 Tax=Paractinoplanes globisporus TaxID=113565 RepID=A0ABW6WB38_9ACTN|nr:TIGR03086 family metal-binding protein [Actinoplanes globisporus]
MLENRLDRAFASTRSVLSTVKPGQFDLPTPCASWDVRSLINHFVGSARWAGDMIAGADGTPEQDYAAGDFLAAYDEYVAAALEGFAVDGVLDRTVSLPFGEMSGADLLDIACTDQFTHGWDLARATGHDTDLDPELAGALLTRARVTILDALRGPEGVAPFGPIVEARPRASAADRLAAFLGRAA